MRVWGPEQDFQVGQEVALGLYYQLYCLGAQTQISCNPQALALEVLALWTLVLKRKNERSHLDKVRFSAYSLQGLLLQGFRVVLSALVEVNYHLVHRLPQEDDKNQLLALVEIGIHDLVTRELEDILLTRFLKQDLQCRGDWRCPGRFFQPR